MHAAVCLILLYFLCADKFHSKSILKIISHGTKQTKCIKYVWWRWRWQWCNYHIRFACTPINIICIQMKNCYFVICIAVVGGEHWTSFRCNRDIAQSDRTVKMNTKTYIFKINVLILVRVFACGFFGFHHSFLVLFLLAFTAMIRFKSEYQFFTLFLLLPDQHENRCTCCANLTHFELERSNKQTINRRHFDACAVARLCAWAMNFNQHQASIFWIQFFFMSNLAVICWWWCCRYSCLLKCYLTLCITKSWLFLTSRIKLWMMAIRPNSENRSNTDSDST